MTKEEILAIEAGIRIDGLVAQNIMGGLIAIENTPPYSADISAAWQVVEKMREEWDTVKVICDSHSDWFIELFKKVGDKWDEVIEFRSHIACMSAPEAICKAALLAKQS